MRLTNAVRECRSCRGDWVTSQALTALREVATKAQELGEEPGSASSKEDDDYSQVLLGLGALLSRESSAAVRVRFKSDRRHWPRCRIALASRCCRATKLSCPILPKQRQISPWHVTHLPAGDCRSVTKRTNKVQLYLRYPGRTIMLYNALY